MDGTLTFQLSLSQRPLNNWCELEGALEYEFEVRAR